MRKSATESNVEPLERRCLLDAVPTGPEFRVNAYTTGGQSGTDIAVDAEGNFVAVWYGRWSGSGEGIIGRRYDAAGQPLGDEFPIHQTNPWRVREPKVAMDASGDFVVVWERMHDFGPYDVYARRFNAAGEAQGGEFRVHTYTTNSQKNADVAMDADGDFVVVWNDSLRAPGNDIVARRFNAAGVPQGNHFFVNTATGFQQEPQIDTDAQGNFLVTWAGRARRYDAAGAPLGNEFPFLENTSFVSIEMRPDGSFVAAWQQLEAGGDDYDVFARRFDAAAQPLGDVFQVNTFTPRQQWHPTVVVAASGDFVVAFDSERLADNDSEVMVRRFDAQGQPRGDEFRVNSYTLSGQAPTGVALDEHGDFTVVWGSWQQDGSLDGLYARRVEVVPVVVDSTFAFETGPQRLRFDFDENVAASLATGDLVLENLTTGQTIPSSDLSLAFDAQTDTATLSYLGTAGGVAGVLPDGNYRATLVAAGITAPGGNPMGADHVLNFFFLNGDATRDGRVNLSDFNVLASNFGQSPRTFSQGDFDYNGVVNLNDFNILAARFGQQLSPAARGLGGSFDQSRDRDGDEDEVSDLLA